MKQAARSQSRPGGEVGLEAGYGSATGGHTKPPEAPLGTPQHSLAPLSTSCAPWHPLAMGPLLHACGISCCLPPGPRSPQQHVALCVRLGTPSEGPGRPRVHQSMQNLGFISIISQQPLSVIICLAGRLQRVVFERSAGVEPAAWKFPAALVSQFSWCFHGFSFTLSKFSVHFLILLGINTTVADGGNRSHPLCSGFTASCLVGTVHRVRS